MKHVNVNKIMKKSESISPLNIKHLRASACKSATFDD